MVLQGSLGGVTIPRYSFFTVIVEELVKIQRKYGVNIKKPLREVRSGARKNYKSEKKIKNELNGFLVQFFAIVAFTWFFSTSLQNTMNFSFQIEENLTIGGAQVFGLFLFFVSFYILKHKFFSPFKKLFCSLYFARCLIFASRPVSEVIELSKLDGIKFTKDLEAIRLKVLGQIKMIQLQGTISKEEIEELTFEVWDQFDESLEKFKTNINAIKLLILLLFVFSGFLYSLLITVGHLGI